MQVKFKETLYDLTEDGTKQTNMPDGSNVLTLELTDAGDISSLTEEATGAEVIQVLNGGEVFQEYLDYTSLRGISLDAEKGTVTVTVRQESLVKQVETLRERNKVLVKRIATLEATAAAQAETIAEQEETIASQAEKIVALESSQSEQDDEITEIQEVLVEDM